MTAIPPPPSEPPGSPGPPPPWTPPPAAFAAQPQWGPYAQPGPKKRGFVWWEALLGAIAGVAGNLVLIIAGSGAGSILSTVLLLFNLLCLIGPLLLRRWSFTVGYVVGVVGAIALFIVIVIYTCSSTYGGSGG